MMMAFHNLGEVARHRGDYGQAAARYEESLALCRELGERWGIAVNLAWLGTTTRLRGEYDRATAYFKESLTLCRALGDKPHTAECLEGLAGLAAALGQPDRAARLLGAAEALREAIDSPLPGPEEAEHHRHVATARASLGEEAFAAAWAVGRATSLEEAVAYALEDSEATC